MYALFVLHRGGQERDIARAWQRMNAKMAPVDHSHGLKGRNDLANELPKRKRGGLFGGGFGGDGSKRGSGNGNSNSNNGNNDNDGNNDGKDKSDDSGKNGNGQDNGHNLFSSLFISTSSHQAAAPTSIAQSTSTAVATVPTTVVFTSPTVQSSPYSISSSVLKSSTTSVSYESVSHI